MFRQLALPRPDGSIATAYLSTQAGSPQARRPLLVYLEGSGAMSHFQRVGEQVGVGMGGLIARKYGDRYQVALVEKRGVSFCYSVDQPGSALGAPPEYQAHATLEDRATDVVLVLDHLLRESDVASSRVLLIGHSEGADVAAAVAAQDARVTHVAVLAGGGAPQFYDFFISQRRQMAAEDASAAKIEAAMTALENQIRDILDKPDSTDDFWLGHAYRRWSSFASQSAADHLVRARASVFAAHGSADQSVPVESFDYLVTRLLISGRRDVTIRRYPGCDHGFGRPENTADGTALVHVIEEVLAWPEGADGPEPSSPDAP